MLRRWFAPEHVDAHFALSPEACEWFTEMALQKFSDDDSWVWLAAARDVPALTADRLEYGGFDPLPHSELWILLGGWSDKHDYLLCCDRTSARFGMVADWNDIYPWADEKAQPDRVWPDLIAFLERPEETDEEQ